jgi:hypothetical protein
MLDRPDPCAPFEETIGNRKQTVVRELVRINHNRNCLLCHAPLDSARVARGVASGLVPTPGQSLPPPWSRQYYGGGSRADVFVRADVTYLRQDFSLMQPARDYKEYRWPEMQRFDFLVRTRPATAQEIASWRGRQGPNSISPQHDALLLTVRELTEPQLGALSSERQRTGSSLPPTPSWRTPCLK